MCSMRPAKNRNTSYSIVCGLPILDVVVSEKPSLSAKFFFFYSGAHYWIQIVSSSDTNGLVQIRNYCIWTTRGWIRSLCFFPLHPYEKMAYSSTDAAFQKFLFNFNVINFQKTTSYLRTCFIDLDQTGSNPQLWVRQGRQKRCRASCFASVFLE